MIRGRTCFQCVSANIVSAESNRNFKLLNQHVQSWRTGGQQVLIGNRSSVNHWLASIQHQVWGGVKKETLFSASSSIVIQLNYEAVQLLGGPGVRQPWGQPLSGVAAPPCSG